MKKFLKKNEIKKKIIKKKQEIKNLQLNYLKNEKIKKLKQLNHPASNSEDPAQLVQISIKKKTNFLNIQIKKKFSKFFKKNLNLLQKLQKVQNLNVNNFNELDEKLDFLQSQITQLSTIPEQFTFTHPSNAKLATFYKKLALDDVPALFDKKQLLQNELNEYQQDISILNSKMDAIDHQVADFLMQIKDHSVLANLTLNDDDIGVTDHQALAEDHQALADPHQALDKSTVKALAPKESVIVSKYQQAMKNQLTRYNTCKTQLIQNKKEIKVLKNTFDQLKLKVNDVKYLNTIETQWKELDAGYKENHPNQKKKQKKKKKRRRARRRSI